MTSQMPDSTENALQFRSRLVFFLGGRDLEMVTIADLIRAQCGPDGIVDKALGWGAKASDYASEIAQSVKDGKAPVLIELARDIDPLPENAIIVDHHNEHAGVDKPTSLEQVFDLLHCSKSEWTRHFALVAANDRGWVPEMRKIGATDQEVTDIRKADRKAQGITAVQERQAEDALATQGITDQTEIAIVDLPHNRFATVTDRLAQDGRTPRILAVRGPKETGLYGPGPVIEAFVRKHPDAWYGGALPDYGYAGVAQQVSDRELNLLRGWLRS